MIALGNLQTKLSFSSYPYPPTEFGGYEPEIVNVLEHFLRPGDCAIDVGASAGFHSCLMSKLVGNEGIILAFEPNQESYDHLCNHVKENDLKNIATIKKALWKEDSDDLNLHSLCRIGYGSLFAIHYDQPNVGVEKVEGRMLDSLLVGSKIHPRLIKIDVEGSENEVLWGAIETLTKGVDCVIAEFNYNCLGRLGRNDHQLREFMKMLGYDLFLINVGDERGLLFPYLVELEKNITLHGREYINVMFSTPEKVEKAWKTKDI